MKEELWRPVIGYESLYEVSNHGLVRTVEHRRPSGLWNQSETVVRGRILKPCQNWAGYLRVRLYQEGRSKVFSIHRLVAIAFVPLTVGLSVVPSGGRLEVNHIDGNKQNNNAVNLEWVTPSENHFHRTRTLKKGSGISSYKAKLSEEQVRQIRRMAAIGKNSTTIASELSLGFTVVWGVVSGKTYRTVE